LDLTDVTLKAISTSKATENPRILKVVVFQTIYQIFTYLSHFIFLSDELVKLLSVNKSFTTLASKLTVLNRQHKLIFLKSLTTFILESILNVPRLKIFGERKTTTE
jgi:hypothetical protein